MCGRYYVDDETTREMERIVRQAELNLKYENSTVENRNHVSSRSGDICPTDIACVLFHDNQRLQMGQMKWGIEGIVPNHLMINARCETVESKCVFANSVQKHRIIIPAAGFYEWNQKKEKSIFVKKDSPVLFMAGIYQKGTNNQDQFVILTTNANESIRPVHDRMPLILEESEILGWLLDDSKVHDYLRKIPVLLQRKTEYEQMSFLDHIII